MARKQSSKFGVTDDLFKFVDNKETENTTQEVREVQEVQQYIIGNNIINKERIPVNEYGSTQGKKGMKMKRINMGFSDQVHYYLHHESRKRGISISRFVNEIIMEYMKEHPYE